jgi:hypothetical protein
MDTPLGIHADTPMGIHAPLGILLTQTWPHGVTWDPWSHVAVIVTIVEEALWAEEWSGTFAG